jgi:hypothetical protein
MSTATAKSEFTSHSLPNVAFPCAMENDDAAIDTKFYDESHKPNVSNTRPKRSSSTYRFSEREIRKYQQARKEGRLRFPDLFMYHIQRPTEDVQREARLMRIIQEQGGYENNPSTESQSPKHQSIKVGSSESQHASSSQEAGANQSKSGKPSLRARAKTQLVRVLPALTIAAAGFVGVLLATGSAGLAVAVAVPTAAIVYGSVLLIQRRRQRILAPLAEINPAA